MSACPGAGRRRRLPSPPRRTHGFRYVLLLWVRYCIIWQRRRRRGGGDPSASSRSCGAQQPYFFLSWTRIVAYTYGVQYVHCIHVFTYRVPRRQDTPTESLSVMYVRNTTDPNYHLPAQRTEDSGGRASRRQARPLIFRVADQTSTGTGQPAPLPSRATGVSARTPLVGRSPGSHKRVAAPYSFSFSPPRR